MASEEIGSLYPTQIPAYTNTADIQAALRLYHYGSEAYDKDNEDPAELIEPSIAHTLYDLQDQITNLDPTGSISKTVINAKGDLIVGQSDNVPNVLSVGSDNFVLTADNSTELGIKWSALPSASTASLGIVQLTNSVSSSSTTTAATPASVKQAYDLASAAAEAGIPVTLMMMGG